jgi:hypothetical protein
MYLKLSSRTLQEHKLKLNSFNIVLKFSLEDPFRMGPFWLEAALWWS